MALFTKIVFLTAMAYTSQAGLLPGGPLAGSQGSGELQLGGSYEAALISSHNEPGPYQAAGQPEAFQGLIRTEQPFASESSGAFSGFNSGTGFNGNANFESAAGHSNDLRSIGEPGPVGPHNVFEGQGPASIGPGASFSVPQAFAAQGPAYSESRAAFGEAFGPGPTVAQSFNAPGNAEGNFRFFQAPAPIIRTIDRPVPFEVVRQIQVPIPQAVQVPVPQPVRVPVPRPYPVHFPVANQVPYPVVRTQTVEVPRAVPYPVEKHVQVVVDRHVRVPVNRPVEVVRQVPVPINNHVSVASSQYAQHYGW